MLELLSAAQKTKVRLWQDLQSQMILIFHMICVVMYHNPSLDYTCQPQAQFHDLLINRGIKMVKWYIDGLY